MVTGAVDPIKIMARQRPGKTLARHSLAVVEMVRNWEVLLFNLSYYIHLLLPIVCSLVTDGPLKSSLKVLIKHFTPFRNSIQKHTNIH